MKVYLEADEVRRLEKAARQQVAQTGFSGTAMIDIHPSSGFLRLKVNVSSSGKLVEFMTNYTNVAVTALAMMNIQAKVNIAKDT